MITYEYLMTSYLWRRVNRTHPETGKAPISLRIEIDGYTRAEMATGVHATEAEWNRATQRLQAVRGMSKEDQQLQKNDNSKLSKLLLQLDQAYGNYKSQGGDPTPTELRLLLRGGKSRDHEKRTLLYAVTALYEEVVAAGRSAATLRDYNVTLRIIREYLAFIRQPLELAARIDRAWLRLHEKWCMAIPWEGTTIRGHFSKIIRALDLAVDEGRIEQNKGEGYRFISVKRKPPKRRLLVGELEKLATHIFSSRTLKRVAVIFLFCCYTGLSYADYRRFALEPHSFITYESTPEGQPVKGFSMQRQKMLRTNTEHWAPLFPEADALLQAHENQLPIYERSYVDKKLKVIAGEVKLSLPDLTHKDARSTFAQLMRDRYGKQIAATLGMHTEEVAQKHYSSESATQLLKELTVLGAALTHN